LSRGPRKIHFLDRLKCVLKGVFWLVRDGFEAVLEACRIVLGDPIDTGSRRGRKSYPRPILMAIIYIAIREGWSLRQAERWCLENFELLKRFGWTYGNPPKKSTFHKMMKEIDVALLQKISAVIKHLKGEIYLPL